MRKSFWWAVLAYLVPTFPLGYFWHLVTFADRYHRLEMYRDDGDHPLGPGLDGDPGARLCLGLSAAVPRHPRAVAAWRHRLRCTFGVMAWSFVVLPVAAKYRMASVQDFIVLETCFTALQFASSRR
jgi:hypothetical protein